MGNPDPGLNKKLCIEAYIIFPNHHLVDMRLRSKLLYVFLAVLLIVASIVEASKGHKKKKKGKKRGKKKKPASTTLHDAPGSDGETLVERNSGPRLESEKDNKKNVEKAFLDCWGGQI